MTAQAINTLNHRLLEFSSCMPFQAQFISVPIAVPTEALNIRPIAANKPAQPMMVFFQLNIKNPLSKSWPTMKWKNKPTNTPSTAPQIAPIQADTNRSCNSIARA